MSLQKTLYKIVNNISRAQIERDLSAGRLRSAKWVNKAAAYYDPEEIDRFSNLIQAVRDTPESYTIIALTDINGRVVHYHHFLLAFLVPLILSLQSGLIRRSTIAFPDMGSLNEKVKEVTKHFGFRAEVYPRGLGSVFSKIEGVRIFPLKSRDAPQVYGNQLSDLDFSILDDFREDLLSGNDINEHSYDVLLINRSSSSPYYMSKRYIREFGKSRQGAGGASRRSVPNTMDLERALREVGRVRAIDLENISLKDTVQAFRDARVVVAQHGAALSNLVWCRKSAGVLEVVPVGYFFQEARIFRSLALARKLNHMCIPQEHEHASVCEEFLSAAASELLEKVS